MQSAGEAMFWSLCCAGLQALFGCGVEMIILGVYYCWWFCMFVAVQRGPSRSFVFRCFPCLVIWRFWRFWIFVFFWRGFGQSNSEQYYSHLQPCSCSHCLCSSCSSISLKPNSCRLIRRSSLKQRPCFASVCCAGLQVFFWCSVEVIILGWCNSVGDFVCLLLLKRVHEEALFCCFQCLVIWRFWNFWMLFFGGEGEQSSSGFPCSLLIN